MNPSSFITRLSTLTVLFIFSFAIGHGAQPTTNRFATNKIRDLALIYQGGSQRIAWSADQIEPYVVHKFADGHKDWLFDGFLFLEFADLPEVNYTPGYTGKRPARKADWEHYLDRLFEKDKALDALNQVIARNKKEIGDPGFRHKVVLTMPTPFEHQKDWGRLGYHRLDFNSTGDAERACRWYLDELIKRFNKAGLDNLELSGIYWVAEDAWTRDGFTQRLSPYIHSKGLQFVWIPYFKAKGFDSWRERGFDIAYHQPNHFFKKEIPDSRLDEACNLARRNGLGMEFECDGRALYWNKDSYYKRMEAYLDAFERHGVFDQSAIAYYTGNHLLIDFLTWPSPENQAIADRLASHIVARRSNPSLTR